MEKAAVVLKKGEGRTLKAGGMWVYDNEIESIMGKFEDGDIIEIRDFDGYCMGQGFINRKSRIAVRLLSRKKDTVIDEATAGAGCLGIPEADHRHIQLPADFRGGGFPAGHYDRQVFGCAGGRVSGPGD